MTSKRVYRVFFSTQGKGYELYARQVEPADLYGFVAVEDLLFGERSELLLDPAEESLKNEFQGVKRLLIPFSQISRIDEVDKEGRGKVVALPVNASSAGQIPLPPEQK